MKLIEVNTSAARRFFWSAALGLAVLLLLTASQSDPVLLGASFVLLMAGFAPLYLWFTGSSHGLPIWPAFSAYSSTIAALPVVQGARSLSLYSEHAIFTGLATTGGFLLIGTLVWLAMTARPPKPPKNCLMLESGTTVRSLFLCVALGLVFQINSVAGWFSYPGNTMPVVRGVTGGLSYLGVFALCYFYGAGLLSKGKAWLFLFMLLALLLLSTTSLMLASSIPILALAFIGFVLGSKKMPWLALGLLLPVFIVLHAGKFQMREVYYNQDGVRKERTSGLAGLVPFYSEWTSYGFEEIGGFTGVFHLGTKSDSAQSSIFERAGNLHMLLLVQQKTPDEVPYLSGITYEPIPQMLVPRFLSPDKAISHVGNVVLSVNYGLLDQDGARTTSVGWSLLAEAYANFGYAGVIVLSILLAALYSGVTRFSSGVPITSLRFICGLIVLAGVTNENSLGVFVTMQFQGVVGAGLASIFLMRRQPNPLAMVEGGEARGRQSKKAAWPTHENRHAEIADPAEGGKSGGWEPESAAAAVDSARQSRGQPGNVQRETSGGVVRSLPGNMPSRVKSWMPKSMQRQVAAARRAADDEERSEVADEKAKTEALAGQNGRSRPRQIGVPFQHYRPYRG